MDNETFKKLIIGVNKIQKYYKVKKQKNLEVNEFFEKKNVLQIDQKISCSIIKICFTKFCSILLLCKI
jgi:hypothetical protein